MRLALIVAAVAGARTAAMGFNRVADRRFDAANPRTANRELPRGAVSRGGAVAVTAPAPLVFVAAAALLGRWPLVLSPVALAILLGYSLAKRFTWATHLWLGVCLGGAPAGAWIAVTNGFGWAPLALASRSPLGRRLRHMYATQDVDFDRARGLGSIPARFGIARALFVSRTLHVAASPAWSRSARCLHLGVVYGVGVAVIAATLAYEQRIVSPTDCRASTRPSSISTATSASCSPPAPSWRRLR